MNKADIINIIKSDPWMMEVLESAARINLPDWMIGAGFVRNKVWDILHGYDDNAQTSSESDIDLIFHDLSDTSKEREQSIERELKRIKDAQWSVKNQARMHIRHNRAHPYGSSEEALSEWVETPTCIAVRLEKNGVLKLFAPHGIEDLVCLIVRPTPAFARDPETFWDRVNGKEWKKKWPKLVIMATK